MMNRSISNQGHTFFVVLRLPSPERFESLDDDRTVRSRSRSSTRTRGDAANERMNE
jgi:hypothetical protein